jgi:hypothetical protein
VVNHSLLDAVLLYNIPSGYQPVLPAAAGLQDSLPASLQQPLALLQRSPACMQGSGDVPSAKTFAAESPTTNMPMVVSYAQDCQYTQTTAE